MTSDKRVSRVSTSIGQVAQTIPVGISPILRRFWNFARDMAQRFSKQLVKDREEDFLKIVRKDFEEWG